MQPGSNDSEHFGIWPSLGGVVLAAVVVYIMFSLATGMR